MKNRKKHNATYYAKNREAQLARVKRTKQGVQAVMRYNKHWAKCSDCKLKHPYWINQYDHLRDKMFTLSKAFTYGKLQLLNELDKCEIVCANCHFERTYRRSKGRLPAS